MSVLGRSEFYLADRVGTPKGPVVVRSFDDRQGKGKRAGRDQLDGCEKFSRLDSRRLYSRPRGPARLP